MNPPGIWSCRTFARARSAQQSKKRTFHVEAMVPMRQVSTAGLAISSQKDGLQKRLESPVNFQKSSLLHSDVVTGSHIGPPFDLPIGPGAFELFEFGRLAQA